MMGGHNLILKNILSPVSEPGSSEPRTLSVLVYWTTFNCTESMAFMYVYVTSTVYTMQLIHISIWKSVLFKISHLSVLVEEWWDWFWLIDDFWEKMGYV